MNRKQLTKTIVAFLIITPAAAFLLFQTIRASSAYYYSIDEFVHKHQPALLQAYARGTQRTTRHPLFRLAGRVKNPSTSGTNPPQLVFELTGKTASLPVRFHGPVPKNFADGKEVIVQGRLGPDGCFLADQILTRCESKYRVRLDATVKRAACPNPTGSSQPK